MKTIATLTAILAMLTAANAASVSWVGGSTGNGRSWGIGSSWNTGSVPASGDDIFIGGTALSNSATTLGGGLGLVLTTTAGSTFSPTVRSITFDNSLNQFSSGSLVLSNSGAASPGVSNSITFTTANIDAIKVLSGNVTLFSRSSSSTLSLNLNYSGLANVDVATGSTLTMAGAGTPILFGTGGITKTGGGTLQLNAVANTFTGGLVVSQGAVEFTSANRLGSEASLNATAVTVNGGALRVTSTGSGTITSALNRGYALGNATGTIEVTNSAITYIIAGAVTDVVGQNGNLTKTGLGVLRLTNNNTFSGVTRVESGTLQSTRSVALASSALVVVTNASSTLALNYGGSENYSQEEVGTLLGKTTFASTSTALGFHTADGNGTLATNLTIAAGLTKLGANTLTLTGTNNYTGATTVSAGTLNLNTTTGSAAGSTTSVSVTNGAILLISQSDQVNNTATVSLSGGTIQLGGVVSETFGALSVTSASFLDFNNAEGVNISFGTYAPTQKITVNNFIGFSTLTFKSDMTTFISNPALFSFANGFSSALWDEPNTTFTITAIPEPGTILAAIGLAGLFAWPLRRHFLRRSDRQA